MRDPLTHSNILRGRFPAPARPRDPVAATQYSPLSPGREEASANILDTPICTARDHDKPLEPRPFHAMIDGSIRIYIAKPKFLFCGINQQRASGRMRGLEV
jgi:hypothetical protein